LVYLSGILSLPFYKSDLAIVNVVVLDSGEHAIGFAVDEIVGEQEILVKNFNSHIKKVKYVSGASVLSSGNIVPVLNVQDLVKAAQREEVMHQKPVMNTPAQTKQRSILVVEDSITSRTLLRNILETAGFEVITAVDGIDGFTKLKEKAFAAVVSDVEMPRMNGFDLTAKIRADKKLGEMPVILVTGLSKNKDKERGIEVGANAYIVKSNFDQSNLLEVVGQFV
jgi:two-component system chemotaxis sensor kinase CheA